jgi:hypothetical protein
VRRKMEEPVLVPRRKETKRRESVCVESNSLTASHDYGNFQIQVRAQAWIA